MEQAEIKAVGDFLSDVYESICEGDETTIMQQQLTELYRVIKRLMDLTSKAPEREKQFFAHAESFNKSKPALAAKNNFCLPPPVRRCYLCAYKALFLLTFV